jgi:hypothetical protein
MEVRRSMVQHRLPTSTIRYYRSYLFSAPDFSFCEDLPLTFAIELLQPLAEGNPKAFATVKERAG